MTENMKLFTNAVRSIIDTKFGDEIPSLDQINEITESYGAGMRALFPMTEDEYLEAKKYLASTILHTIGYAVSLKGHDATHKTWYFLQENDGFYWNRYKKFLKDKKHWSPDVVNRLHTTTNDVMDDLGNPNDKDRPFQRRGLLLGDVQSGKTATYTAICNKAADANYKVIIVLAGMMENLRVQTQERLDAEFVGKESKYTLDRKADNEIRNHPVGVGKIQSDNERQIACFTSVATDFNKTTLKQLGLSLSNLNGTALFVVKKNKSVLNNLYRWLLENNASHEDGLIDLPLLLIDDEADNASVNTNSEEKDPTAINAAIRNILNCFKQASYLGITATPFANIFIDPEDETDEAARDLFPKDFLTVLPTPENYIGADRIFGNGNADEWDNESDGNRNLGEFNDALIPIENEEQDSFFYFKHKKEIAYELTDIPASMKEAIRYFILSSAISDYRRDYTEHRSMLVNVSRFTLVQNQTADIIESFLNRIKLDLENYAQLPAIESMKINSISMLFDVWNKYNLDKVIDIDWEEFLQKYLYKATRRIEVRSVNQSSGASALDYHNYKDIGMRVIAVGGNSLSRGLTLEGLMVSYFYRNTMMYDTLLQMGRWFGYRPGYEDLFKVWMAEDAIDWYGYIIDAVNELKQELYKMKRQNLTPKEFGLKVRQAPGALLVTARNKMRTGTMVKRPITVSGRMLETPRLKGDKAIIDNNEALCRNFIKSISASANWKYDDYTKSFIWKDIPKEAIIEIVRAFETHPWNLNFQPIALADYILDSNLDKWDVAIPNGSSDSTVGVETFDDTIHVNPEMRRMEKDLNYKNMIRINGHHVRVGTGGCSKIGLPKDTIQYIRKKNNKKCNDKTYLIKDRNPLLLLHILENSTKKDDDDMPIIMFALGLGFPDDGIERTANYVVNVKELENWVDDIALEDDDDDEFNN